MTPPNPNAAPTPNDLYSMPTPIALLAVGRRDRALLEMMLQRFLRNEFIVVDAKDALMAIVDCDSSEGMDALREWQTMKPDAPTLMLALRPLHTDARTVTVLKPINIHTLIDMLSELRPLALRAATSAVKPSVVLDEARVEEQKRPLPVAEELVAQPKPKTNVLPLPYPRPIPIPAAMEQSLRSPGLVPVGGEAENQVISVEICMSDDLDEIFQASGIKGIAYEQAEFRRRSEAQLTLVGEPRPA